MFLNCSEMLTFSTNYMDLVYTNTYLMQHIVLIETFFTCKMMCLHVSNSEQSPNNLFLDILETCWSRQILSSSIVFF